MKYKIITAANVGTLEQLVNQAITEGWKPQGGVGADGSFRMVCQAMVR